MDFTEQPRSYRPSSIVVFGAALFAALASVVAPQLAESASSSAGTAAPVPVVTATVTQKDVPDSRLGIGTILPAQSVTVKVRVDGQLEKVAFVEGQEVKQGELLAQIDARPYQAQLNQVIAQKAHDEATLAAAVKDLDRYTMLVADGSISQQTVDTQKATVAQLKASVQSDQAQIDNAQVQLGYTTIRAPTSGRTGMRLIDAGNMVHAADTTGLVIINQIDPIAVVFTLPEDDFQTVNQAIQNSGKTPLQVTAMARQDGTVIGTGHLLVVNNQIDTSTGTFQLKALFSNPKHTLWPGQYVNVSLQIGMRHNALIVPETAVQRGPNETFVYVVKPDGSVAAQTIHAVQNQDGRAIVDKGLTAGQRIVVDGQFKIRPGMKVAEADNAAASSSKQQSGARP